jgi:hypothetical protein
MSNPTRGPGGMSLNQRSCWVFADQLNEAKVMTHAVELAKGVRLSGSDDEARAFAYIDHNLRRVGFTTHIEHAETLISFPARAELEVMSPVREVLRCNTYSLAPSTPAAGITADLVDVGAGHEDDYRRVDARGKVALSSGLAIPGKAVAVDGSGAVGQIHINDDHLHEMCISAVWGSPTPQTVALLPKTPAVGITAADGALLRDLVARGPVTVRLHTKVDTRWRHIPTLVADLPGRHEDTFVLFSAHVDSWYLGAMDNAGGTAALVAIGELLAERRDELRRGIRLALWSGHSHGRYAGSTAYADSHWSELHEKCVCHVTIDSVGGTGASVLSVASSMAETYDLAARLVREGTGQELDYRRIGRAGDQSFWGIGVPSLFDTLSQQPALGSASATGASALTGSSGKGGGFGWWWHTEQDTMERLDPANLLRDTRVYAAAIWELCTAVNLPFDFARSAREIRDQMRKYQAIAGDSFDLHEMIGLAEKLVGALDDFSRRPAADPRSHNDLLQRIGHELVPLNYTAGDPFEHDPAVHLGVVPGLRDVAKLNAADRIDDESKMLYVKLLRDRNRAISRLTNALALSVGGRS